MSASETEYVVSISTWIPIPFCYFVALFASGILLQREYKKRKSLDIVWTSKVAQMSSLLCIISVVITLFLGMISFFNGFCYFAFKISIWTGSFSTVCMGVFQLDRIAYCFSANKVYSKHGYPTWLFVLMYTYATLLMLWQLYTVFLVNIPNGRCYIDSNGTFYDTFNRVSQTAAVLSYWMPFYMIWDIATLILYAAKVIYIRKYASIDKPVHERIMAILQRILMLTIMYEVMGIALNLVLSAWSGIFGDAVPPILPNVSMICTEMVYAYSMYLMQHHNDEEYRRFLKLIYRFRLHYICCFCCCASMIEQEIVDPQSPQARLQEYAANDGSKEVKPKISEEDSTYDTRDESVKMEHTLHLQRSLDTTAIADGAQ